MEIKIILTEGQIAQVLNETQQKLQQGPETYSIIGAANQIGISKTKIHQMIKDGAILKIMIGKSPRIHRSEIERLITNPEA
jgi:excisionase family DNA binding protein